MIVSSEVRRLLPPWSFTPDRLGRAGESRAALGYRLRGYAIVERNVRFDDGEIDLVARRGNVLAIVEVKTRTSTVRGEPWEAVGAAKRRKLVSLARRYLARRRPGDVRVRFDVVSVLWTGFRFRVERFEDAFRPEVDENRPWIIR